jgi:hypothetical protein
MITKDVLHAAPPFTVFFTAFPEMDVPDPGLTDDQWDMFETNYPHSSGVEQELERLGICLMGGADNPEIDDVEAKDTGFDDFDAALMYLRKGGALVKVPDALHGPKAEYYVLYAVGSMGDPDTDGI